MKYYIYSIILYYTSFVLFTIRMFANKEEINIKKNKKIMFDLFRISMVSLLPIINIIVSITAIYTGLLMPNDKYIKFMNK